MGGDIRQGVGSGYFERNSLLGGILVPGGRGGGYGFAEEDGGFEDGTR